MNNETDIIVPDNVIETIDEHFPKGDKRRGDALVVNAVGITEGFRLGKEEAIKSIIELLNIHSSDCDRSLSKNDLINFRRELKELSEEEKE